MKLAKIKTIMLYAQKDQRHGNIFTTSGHSVAFEFYSGPGYGHPDIIDNNPTTEVVKVLSRAANSYIDCASITHIVTYPHKD